MRFETEEDKARELKAITKYISVIGGSYEKLGDNDIDFRVYDKNNRLSGYVEVKGCLKEIKDAYPLKVSARKIVKLSDKRLKPVIIWACLDGIVYAEVKKLNGRVRWGGREQRAKSSHDQEVMLYFEKQSCMKYIKY